MAKTNNLLHALRLWGIQAEFGDDPSNPYTTGTPSGARMLELLLDSEQARRADLGPYPFFFRTGAGEVGVQHRSKGGGFAHPDQYLKAMGELTLPSATLIRLPDGSTATFRDLIEHSTLYFDIEQELEFTVVAYSRWLPPNDRWQDRHGRLHTFDDMARALLERVPGDASCYGVHLMYALVHLFRVNQEFPILDRSTAARVENRLRLTSALLERNQDPSGVWLGHWHQSVEPSEDESCGFQAICATGHHLEWIAYAPERLRPSRPCIERAALALARLIGEQSIETISGGYAPASHAARSLALLNDVAPGTLFRIHEAPPGGDDR